ncbi:DedA family protein [Haloarchaeobius sp. DYHT-AS-18]|uniref:DedA family protein n=1 Tax=Haloarchaeobius sp. DYHT-AS-18 TaxID=3446117 RepID=UPI003EB9EC04
MVELAWLTDFSIAFIESYGFIALFVFVVLETSFILHFIPSEVVIPLAALFMITGPTTFGLFVAVSVVGGIIGSLLCYWLFGVNGERLMRRWGHIVRMPDDEIDKSQEWFNRYGEGLMFWGRFLPVLRTPISIPAGFAKMDLTKFSFYSGAGWAIYVAALAGLGYSNGGEAKAPIEVAWAAVWPVVQANPVASTVVVVLVTALGTVAWQRRRAFPF